ncbi:hypothetical protein ACFL0T_07295 [Candidatus Omnitrophota bacterium]
MNIDQQKAKTILNALIYQDIIDEANKENRGEKITHDKPLIKEFARFCGLSDEKLDDLYDEIFENLEEYENYSFWENFAEKVAIVKREEEKNSKKIELSQDEAFIVLSRYMDKVNDILDDADLVDLWKYIAKYFKTNSVMQTNG